MPTLTPFAPDSTPTVCVFRLETPDGHSPLRHPSFEWTEVEREKLIEYWLSFPPDSFPTPKMEFGNQFKEGIHVCGTTEYEGIITWFSPVLKTLNTKGYGVFEYRLPSDKILIGKSQICFDPKDATSRQHFSIFDSRFF